MKYLYLNKFLIPNLLEKITVYEDHGALEPGYNMEKHLASGKAFEQYYEDSSWGTFRFGADILTNKGRYMFDEYMDYHARAYDFAYSQIDGLFFVQHSIIDLDDVKQNYETDKYSSQF